jgi:hypothetical protein
VLGKTAAGCFKLPHDISPYARYFSYHCCVRLNYLPILPNYKTVYRMIGTSEQHQAHRCGRRPTQPITRYISVQPIVKLYTNTQSLEGPKGERSPLLYILGPCQAVRSKADRYFSMCLTDEFLGKLSSRLH